MTVDTAGMPFMMGAALAGPISSSPLLHPLEPVAASALGATQFILVSQWTNLSRGPAPLEVDPAPFALL